MCALRVSHEYLARGLDAPDDDIWLDVEQTTLEAVALSLEDDARAAVRKMPKSQRVALNRFYADVARGGASQTRARVRDAIVGRLLNDKVRSHAQVKEVLRRSGISRGDDDVVRTLVITHAGIAVNGATWARTRWDPELWGYELVTRRDERVRLDHRPFEGVRYPKNHPFWTRYVPPNGFGCRCKIRPIYKGEKRATTKRFPGVPKVDPAFRFNPGGIFVPA